MNIETRILDTGFRVPVELGHRWIITRGRSICVLEGVPGKKKARLTTGAFATEDGPMTKQEAFKAWIQFNGWLDESIGEMRKMCHESE